MDTHIYNATAALVVPSRTEDSHGLTKFLLSTPRVYSGQRLQNWKETTTTSIVRTDDDGKDHGFSIFFLLPSLLYSLPHSGEYIQDSEGKFAKKTPSYYIVVYAGWMERRGEHSRVLYSRYYPI